MMNALCVLGFISLFSVAFYIPTCVSTDKRAHRYFFRKGWRNVMFWQWIVLVLWIPWILVAETIPFVTFVFTWKPGGGSNGKIR
jgi:uncharacterized membrane protein